MHSLLNCGCIRSAKELCQRGLQTLKGVAGQSTTALENLLELITQEALSHFESRDQNIDLDSITTSDWPEQGLVRREAYPWNDYEPDRLSQASLQTMNAEMRRVAPKLEVRMTHLPSLLSDHGELDQR